MKSKKIPLYFSHQAVAWLHYRCQIELICESSPLPVKQGIIFSITQIPPRIFPAHNEIRKEETKVLSSNCRKQMICTCLLITGPRSASGSVPEFTFRALARSTSFSSLKKVNNSLVINKDLWLQSKNILQKSFKILHTFQGQKQYNDHRIF